ncbi:MAG: thiol reductant ABC exporter subunit CydD [Anaerolineaceae bacterium]|nr:thiol reductant ABC exporter subunit CydD [Anaerolineaceae bacterium]
MVRQTGWLFPAVVLFGLISGGLIILQSLQLSQIINSVFLEAATLSQVAGGLRWLLAVVLVRVLFTLLNETLANQMAVRIKTTLRSLLLQKIDRLGPAYTTRGQSGELVTTALQGIEALDAYFSQYLPQVLLAAFLPLMILAVVFPLDWVSGLVFLLTAPLIPFFMALVGRASETETKRQWKALTRLGADFLDTLQGLTTLKLLGQGRNQIQRVTEVSDRYRDATMNVLRITFLSALVLELLATISTAVVAVEVGLRLLYGHLQFQQAFFVLLLAPEFYQPLRNLGARYHAGMNGVTASVRIFQLLDEPEPQRLSLENPTSLMWSPQQPFELNFQSVSFAYPDQAQDALHQIDLTLTSGKSYALVGRSGAGKSTLFRLLLRFIEPGSGSLLWNGTDVRSFALSEWRQHVSWVGQRPMLFNTSVRENIRLLDECYSDASIWQALEQAHLAEFIHSLPDRLNTPLGEWGSRLSGGQSQRIALARAFLRDTPLLLLDEPNAHLDPELEVELVESMRRLMLGKTTLTIAHRLNSFRSADELIVLESGQVVQRGTFAALSGQPGPLQELLTFTAEDK